jgi:folate-dependent phosphoribosylglycinamide formyltransferase PurN
MSSDNRWIALFSQTGSEIVEISERLNKWPDAIITNNSDYNKIHPSIQKRGFIKINQTQARTLNILHRYAQYNDLITLNGWLKIVPADKCEQYNIVNGHPGLITRYPELKGFDPQKRFWADRSKYDYYGSIVHEVTAEVDEGKILSLSEKVVDGTEQEPFNILKATSLDAWLDFFKHQDIIKV